MIDEIYIKCGLIKTLHNKYLFLKDNFFKLLFNYDLIY